LSPEHTEVYAYTKEYEGEKMLVLLNFVDNEVSYTLPEGWSASAPVHIGNYEGDVELQTGTIKLRPYEAVALVQ
jgi:oligo-1,6-glucosidase